MKIALAQINTTVGNLSANTRKIVDWIGQAKAANADVVLFPELAITGYPPRDLLDRRDFVQDAIRQLAEVQAASKGISVVVGNVQVNETGIGKDIYNAAYVFEDGQLGPVYRKILLPTYDVFDEARHFEPGRNAQPSNVLGRKVALSICEDIWDDPDYSPQRRYGIDPVGQMLQDGAGAVLNLSASPYCVGKPYARYKMLSGIASKYDVPLAYVNSVGGNDELIFDGNSTVLDRRGRVVARASAFQEDLLVADISSEGEQRWLAWDEEEEIWNALVLGLRDYVHKCGFKTAVLGLSGGIDSALTATLAAEALGPENVWGISMPSRYTADMSRADGFNLAKNLGIRFAEIPIEGAFMEFMSALKPAFAEKPVDVTEENLQSRIRGTILMALSNKHHHMLLSTGNKSEVAVGYCTLYGDTNGGLAVISDVPKTMVYRLAEHVNKCFRLRSTPGDTIPTTTITRPPSAELRDGQSDQDSLPPYDVLDRILHLYIVERKSINEVVGSTCFDRSVVEDVVRKVERAEFKRRQAPPGLKVTAKAFGMGRRYPIARGRK